MNKKSIIGKLGEDLASEYLLNKGYTIIERNFWKPWGELDIVAKDSANTLVFVEVKAMRQIAELPDSGLLPEYNLTFAKLRKLKRTAQLYVGHHQELVDEKVGWRIDLVAILINDNNEYTISHYENTV